MNTAPTVRASRRRRDPLACTSLDAALCLAALAISTYYALALMRLGLSVTWGALAPGVFWVGLAAAPIAAIVPAWLLGRFSPVNAVWPGIGLAFPWLLWAVGLFREPAALLLIGGTGVVTLGVTVLAASRGRRRRNAGIIRKGRCPDCGYDLGGLSGAVCPECGGVGG